MFFLFLLNLLKKSRDIFLWKFFSIHCTKCCIFCTVLYRGPVVIRCLGKDNVFLEREVVLGSGLIGHYFSGLEGVILILCCMFLIGCFFLLCSFCEVTWSFSYILLKIEHEINLCRCCIHLVVLVQILLQFSLWDVERRRVHHLVYCSLWILREWEFFIGQLFYLFSLWHEIVWIIH